MSSSVTIVSLRTGKSSSKLNYSEILEYPYLLHLALHLFHSTNSGELPNHLRERAVLAFFTLGDDIDKPLVNFAQDQHSEAKDV